MKEQPPIRIESILGGQSQTTHFANRDQFRASLGIDPAQPIDDNDTVYSTIASGLIRPVASEKFSGTTITAAPLWIIPNPKDANVYVYDALSSAYTINATMTTVTALSDGGSLSGIGNGAEYYDNYIYFATGTDIARYGPLNGAPAFNGTYWTGTLGKSALTNTTYPTTYLNGIQLPNHVLHRDSDGKLFIADVVGNNGTLHYIQTTKTTVEGDTDNGSTINALTFGYGLWPTAIESAGDQLVVALYEGASSGVRQKNAKVAFWNKTSTSFNQIVFQEFPDQIITAMKNVNGSLFIVSGNYQSRGFRVSKYIGGYSFQEVYYSETGEPCLPGAIDGTLNRVLYGSNTTVPETAGCVYATGLAKTPLTIGTFNIMRATGSATSTQVTALSIADNVEFGFYVPIIGWTSGAGSSTHGLDKQGTTYSNAPSVFWSQTYRMGAPFQIKRIRIPISQSMAANMAFTVKVYTDDGNGQTYTSPTINNTNFPNQERSIALRPNGLTGQNNFWIELRFTGSALVTVSVPIIIDWGYTNDQ